MTPYDDDFRAGYDYDPRPRCFPMPSGGMKDLPDGSQHLPDLRGQSSRPAAPELKTRSQKRRWARDLAILAGRRKGMTLRELAGVFELTHVAVLKILRRMKGEAKSSERVSA